MNSGQSSDGNKSCSHLDGISASFLEPAKLSQLSLASFGLPPAPAKTRFCFALGPICLNSLFASHRLSTTSLTHASSVEDCPRSAEGIYARESDNYSSQGHRADLTGQPTRGSSGCELTQPVLRCTYVTYLHVTSYIIIAGALTRAKFTLLVSNASRLWFAK